MWTIIPGSLADAMPREFRDYQDTPAMRLKDVLVKFKISRTHESTWMAWPGPQKNVYFWVILENGKAVGFNENPAKGWSFPVIGPACVTKALIREAEIATKMTKTH